MRIDLEKELKDKFGLNILPSKERRENFEEALSSSTVLSKVFLLTYAFSKEVKGNPIYLDKQYFARVLNKSKAYIHLYFEQLVDYNVLKKERVSPKKVKYIFCFNKFYDKSAIDKLLFSAKESLGGYTIKER